MERVTSVAQRKLDKEIYSKLSEIIRDKKEPIIALKRCEESLQLHKSVNTVLMETGSPPKLIHQSLKLGRREETIYCGTPAKYLTYGDMLRQRKREKLEEIKAKELKKERKVERERRH